LRGMEFDPVQNRYFPIGQNPAASRNSRLGEMLRQDLDFMPPTDCASDKRRKLTHARDLATMDQSVQKISARARTGVMTRGLRGRARDFRDLARDQWSSLELTMEMSAVHCPGETVTSFQVSFSPPVSVLR
jgi:hypothetical protein